MKHENNSCELSSTEEFYTRIRIIELENMQRTARKHNVDIDNGWIEEEIKDLQVSLKGCL